MAVSTYITVRVMAVYTSIIARVTLDRRVELLRELGRRRRPELRDPGEAAHDGALERGRHVRLDVAHRRHRLGVRRESCGERLALTRRHARQQLVEHCS